MNYCTLCGRDLEQRVPDGDERLRHVCTACGHVHYQNPRLVVGAVATWEDRLLLCRRAIEPRRGYWTLPAGFMELGEGTAEGARREAREEANAELAIRGLLAVYDLEHIGQVQLFYAADLLSPDVSPGPESLEVGLFRWEDIPWDDLAFPSVRWALRYHHAMRGRPDHPPELRPGLTPDG